MNFHLLQSASTLAEDLHVALSFLCYVLDKVYDSDDNVDVDEDDNNKNNDKTLTMLIKTMLVMIIHMILVMTILKIQYILTQQWQIYKYINDDNNSNSKKQLWW